MRVLLVAADLHDRWSRGRGRPSAGTSCRGHACSHIIVADPHDTRRFPVRHAPIRPAQRRRSFSRARQVCAGVDLVAGW